MKKVIVIGGGAAGMLAAIAAAQNGHEVHLYEKNEKLGKKLFITGKGRCNLTNASDFETFFQNIVTNRKFLYSALYAFTNGQIVELVEKNGVPTKTERGNRVFPASDKSSDVIRALTRELERQGVKIHLNAEVADILTEEKVSDGGQDKSGAKIEKKSKPGTTDEKENGSGTEFEKGNGFETEFEKVAGFGTEFEKKIGPGSAPEKRVGLRSESGVKKVAGIRLSSGETVSADALIVTTGGVSYKSTGSTGDGIAFANRLGIRTTRLRPALVPLVSDDDVCPRLMGLSLKNVRIKIRQTDMPDEAQKVHGRNSVIQTADEKMTEAKAADKEKTVMQTVSGNDMEIRAEGSRKKAAGTGKRGKKSAPAVLCEDFGEMIFTHFGVSGPVILSASSLVGKELEQGPLLLEIDLKPALDETTLDHRLLREIEASPKKQVRHMLEELLPKKMIPVIAERSGLPEQQRAGDITKEQRRSLLMSLKAFTIRIRGTRGFDEAIITQGGVDVGEINAHTMESRRVPGLYFAGEVLDVDALTGGYNLQIAWSTGWLAGTAASAGSKSV